ncbi:TylF/MycF family methyltransferase [Paenibacillus brevis]|uniref:TylF/MycF family methyltransferase n=1 Tax=Paenibacillus brevis TaxID=2841508 RepID=A0ABS6FUG3_9BACL|nr:TylF/MycF family methyltransferase [Paenibacillus brevis]MBU5673883.1 TylF/MycF family methyltransferase [Paenibacillus brevis]
MVNKSSAKELYLEILKKTILGEIWLEQLEYGPIPSHIRIPEELTKELSKLNLEILHKIIPNKEKRNGGLDWPLLAHSMIGRLRLNNLHECLETVINESIEGDFIETGVWRGGSCIFARGFLKANDITDRNIWVADSFEGLPKPELERYPQDAGDIHHTYNFLRVSLEEVQNNFKQYDLLDNQVKFLKGWFKDTLPVAPIEKIAIARLDGDMYSSTMDGLVNLYDKVVPGGFIIIDDYGLENCKQAVTDFRNSRQITEPLITIDKYGVYWRKTL